MVPHTFIRLFIIVDDIIVVDIDVAVVVGVFVVVVIMLFDNLFNNWWLTIATATVTTTARKWIMLWGSILVMLAFIISSMKERELATTIPILCTSRTIKATIKKSTSFASWQTLNFSNLFLIWKFEFVEWNIKMFFFRFSKCDFWIWLNYLELVYSKYYSS